jgi:hypothetical protein
MVLHQTQKLVATDNHDYRVVDCGRQWGKTTLAVMEMVACAYAKNGREVAYFATTFDQARNIAWEMLKKQARSAFSRSPNESRLFIKTQDGGESRITLRGFENVETARGQQFDLLVIDEVAFMRNWEYAWGQILEPTLAFRQGKALFISTPMGYNHFKKMYDEGLSPNSKWKSWRFTSYDNPYLSKEWIDDKKKERTPEAFATEYLADFKQFYGLVYKEFSRETNVIEPFDIPDSWSRYRAMDFGSTNPTACLWIATDGDDNWFIYQEHYETGQTIEYHAGIINSKSMGYSIVATYGDPSGAQFITEFAQRGIYITPATKETSTAFNTWVRYKIEKVAEKLKSIPGHTLSQRLEGNTSGNNGSPALYVFSNCTNTIREFETYRWKEKSVTQAQDLNEPDVPEKANDHAMDALSYFACSYKKQTPNYHVNDFNAWKIE